MGLTSSVSSSVTSSVASSVLAPLQDVAGVIGSFVVDPAGELVAESLPPAFDDADWASIAGHLHRLQDALASLGHELDQVTLRFAEQKLVLRKSANGLVCAIVEPDVNMPALHMATHLVARRLEASPGA